MTPAEIRALIARLKAERRSLNDACKGEDGSIRAFAADEQAKYDSLTAQINDAKASLARAEDNEDDAPPPSAGVRSKPPGPAPAVGTAAADQQPYSLMKAIRSAAEGRPLDGLEAEVDQEIRRRTPGRVFKGFAMPTSNDPAIRSLMYPGESGRKVAGLETRDLTTTTGAATIFVEPRSYIELLRSKLVVRELGVQIISDLQGLFAIPRETGSPTGQWVGEGVSTSPTNPTFDQIPFSPKLYISTTVITKQFMMQTSIDVDLRLRAMLSDDQAQAFDRAVLNGPGGASPLGILQDPSIPTISLGTNGGPLTYNTLVDMETSTANTNVDTGSISYLLNPTLRGSLKKTFVGTAGYPVFVYDKGIGNGVGEINTYPARATTLMPNNLTKGTSTNCSAIVLGRWNDLTVGIWDTGVDVIVDPYTGKRAGNVEITMEMAMDSHPTRSTSFIKATDVTPS